MITFHLKKTIKSILRISILVGRASPLSASSLIHTATHSRAPEELHFHRWFLRATQQAAFNFHENVWKSVEQTAAILSFKMTVSVQWKCVFHTECHHHPISRICQLFTHSPATVNPAEECQVFTFLESVFPPSAP